MLNDTIIKALEEKGFKRWTKGNMDRMYINAEALGLDCDYYKRSGRISGATFKGEHVSNNHATEMKAAKTFIDIQTGEVRSTSTTLRYAAQEIFDEIIEAQEAATEETKEATETTTETATVSEIVTEPEAEEEKEDKPMNKNFEIKAKIVRAGESKVFKSWNHIALVTMEDFLDGLRWLCDDPMPDGKLTRELGCVGRIGVDWTEEERKIWGDVQTPADIGLHRLTRCYYSDGTFAGFRDQNGQRWESSSNRASISVKDHI